MIKIEDLGFSYGTNRIFENVNLEIKKGELTAILGANGCGKTTLINCILNFLKPQEGKVLIENKEVIALKAVELAKKIAYVPQNHRKTFPFTSQEIVLMGRTAYTLAYSSPKAEDLEIALEALDLVGMAHMAEKPYVLLSGGESQLVMLARAIAQQTPAIILDEPTAHLDNYNELLVLERTSKLIKEKGLTVVMTTHHPNQILYLESNEISVNCALMKKGGIMYKGPACDAITEEKISQLYNIQCAVLEKAGMDGKIIKYIAAMGIGCNDEEIK